MKFPQRIAKWFKSFWAEKRHFQGVVFIESMSDLPDHLDEKAFVVRKMERDVWLVFDCPCERGHRLTINLSTHKRPYWTVKIKGKTLDVYPSIWVKDTCRSHFWIKDSNIIQAMSDFR